MVSEENSVAGAKINHKLLVSFLEGFGTHELPVSFKTGSLHVKDFLCLFHAGTAAATKAFLAVMTEKSQCSASEQFTTGFAVNEDSVLQELSTEQVGQIPPFLCVFKYSERNLHILHLFFCLLRGGSFSVQFFNEA